jgi:DamX protein
MNEITDQARHELVERLALNCPPFGDDSAGVFFVGGQRRFLVQQAMHALYFARGLVLLSGAEGVGKTRIADEVCRELQELCDICRLDASVMMDDGEIRQRLCTALGLATTAAADDQSLLAALDQLRPDEGDPLPVLLVIDDAQHLAVPVLHRCHALVAQSQGRIRLLLVGAPELLLAWEQTGKFDADQIDVLPLDAQETADYVATCLQAAGFRGENPLNDQAMDVLYRESRGNIGAINTLAPTRLLDALGGSRSEQRGRLRLPLPHVALAVGLLMFVALVALFFSGDTDEQIEPEAAAPVVAEAADRRVIALPVPPLATAGPPAAETVAEVAPTSPAASAAAPASAPASPAPVPEPPASASAPVSPAASPVPPPAVKPVDKPASVAKPAAKPAATPSAPVATAAVSADAKALLAMSSKHFVVQLIAAHSKPRFDAFLAGSARGVKVYTYTTRRDGKPWYVAVTGSYPDKTAARAAIERLPKPLRDQKPWLRSVASVHADIRAK